MALDVIRRHVFVKKYFELKYSEYSLEIIYVNKFIFFKNILINLNSLFDTFFRLHNTDIQSLFKTLQPKSHEYFSLHHVKKTYLNTKKSLKTLPQPHHKHEKVYENSLTHITAVSSCRQM